MGQWIHDLWEIGRHGKYGFRMPGTAAGRLGAEYVLDRFRQFGIRDARIEKTDAPLCLPDAWGLSARSSGGTIDIPCSFIRYAGFTPAEGLTAPL